MDRERAEHIPEEPLGAGAEASDVTLLLNQAQAGNDSAAEQLLKLVYAQLRSAAGYHFRSEDPNHTLQPTALVHEAYLKLVGGSEKQWDSRAHFNAVASIAMRQVLRDHARDKRAVKRGGGAGHREPLTIIASPSGTSTVDLIP